VNLHLTILTPITLVISGYVCYGQATTGYQDTIFSSLGCDSIIYNYIYQALAPIDTSVTYISYWNLYANAIGFPAYTYQWLYSYYANGSLSTSIAGSTSDTLMPMGYGYGYFAVIISDTFHHCSDTSSWYGFFCQGIKLFNKKVDFQLYPNPTTNYCTLKISQPGTYQVQLHDNLAQLLHTFYPATPNGMYKLALDNYPKGLYWLMVKEVYTGLVSWKQVIID
jgi:hypothetical protein